MRLFKSLLLVSSVLAASLSAHAQEVDASTFNPAAEPTNQAPSSIPIEGIAAIVNDEVISYTDVRNRAQLILVSLGVQPNENTIRQAQQRAIEGLIDEHLQLQEASEFELVVGDEDVENALNNLAARSGATRDAFLADLQARGINPETLRHQVRADIAWQRLVGGRFGSRLRVSDLQIKDNLERLQKSLDKEQMRVAEIFLPAIGPEQTAQMLQGAWDLRSQIQDGAPFSLVAQQFSAAPTASSGGELGWMSLNQVKPELSDAVSKIEAPGISEPIVVDGGVYLVALLDKREPIEAKLTSFKLQQLVATGNDAATQLSQAVATASGCSDLQSAAATNAEVNYIDLGVMNLDELNLGYQEMFANTVEGAPTDILSLSGGRSAVVYVCDHIMSRGSMPSRDEVEDRLHDEMLALQADRYLRDIKREATIIRR